MLFVLDIVSRREERRANLSLNSLSLCGSFLSRPVI